jgi:Tfp pilus assembly protein FimT
MLQLLITGAIIGVLAAAAIPGFSVWYPNYRLRSAARAIFSDLQLAKLQAVRANNEYGVVFDPGAGRYQVVSGGVDQDYGTMDDVVEKTVVLADEYGGDVVFGHGHATSPIGSGFGDEVTLTANRATFNPRGLGKSGYVYIANRKGRSIVIGTRWTGMIVMKKWNDSTSRWE